MRLDIFISTDVLSPRPREGSYRSLWVGYGDSGRKLGEDGTMGTAFGNQYGLLILALKEAAAHINANVRPEVRICVKNGIMIQAIRNLKTWESRDFKKRNGQQLSHAEEWRYIASRLHGLYFKVEGGKDEKKQVGNSRE